MSLLDILSQYAGGTPQPGADVASHFDQAAQQASPHDLGRSLAAAFRSDQTPAFGQIVGQLFDRSDPQQQAGVLNQILQSIGPAALSSVAGGVLGRVLGGLGGGGLPTVTPQQAQQVPPEAVEAAAAHAEQRDGSIVDKLGQFYAQHPDVVKGLGAAALAVALGHLHQQSR